MNPSHKMKITVLGDEGVGKTSLVDAYTVSDDTNNNIIQSKFYLFIKQTILIKE
jgi:GTPase SAR1 family protein